MNGHDSDAEGMTLVEIIVTISVAALVLALIAVSFVNGMTAQRDGVARDSATGAANVVSSSLTSSIRNSVEVKVSSGGKRLDAKFIAPDGTAECRAWELLTDVNGAGVLVFRANKTAALPAGTLTWGALAHGVKGTLGANAVFAASGSKGVQIGMEVTADEVTIAITDGVTAQAVSEGALKCWP